MYSQIEIIKKAAILLEKKEYFQAREILLDFIKSAKNIKPDIKLYYTLYLVFEKLKEFQNAKRYLEKCLKINKSNHIVLNNLANLYLKEGNIYKAEKFYLKSFSLKKDYIFVIVNLAIFYQNIGKLNESKKFYLKAIELSPKRISIYFNLSRLDKNFMNEDRIKYLSNLMKNEKLELSEMSYGFFLLAEDQRKKKNFTQEIDYLKKANKFGFNSMKKTNSQTLNYWLNDIIKKCKNFEFINDDEKSILKNLKPVFIVGLPRTGSTIIEVLLSSASKNIASIGEANIFNGILAKNFSNTKDILVDLDFFEKKVLENFQSRNLNIKNSIFIDKSLENFFYVDVILKIFPKAIFINTTRNIQDNIFAIYKQSLSKLSWTHSIENILDYTDNYFKTINHFIKKHPKKFFTINLEELTENPKKIAKKLFTFCDLVWSDKVLEFYNREDLLISTASNIQIRDNIKKYEKAKYNSYKILLKNFLNEYDWLNQK